MARPTILLLSAPLLLLSSCGHSDEVIDGVVLPDVEFAGFLLGVKHTHLHLVPGKRVRKTSPIAARRGVAWRTALAGSRASDGGVLGGPETLGRGAERANRRICRT
ncbi:hypothetical protein [Sorangium sp. So ce363]|uniref:hypothetical protein n=1 Tax=Sorangium sp. So ce363 TaxID=3133304 RepID=UPI003F5EFBC8